MNRYAFAAGAAALSLLVAACGSSGTTTTTPAPGASAPSATSPDTGSGSGSAAGGVVIKDFKFGGTLTAKAGEKVTVKNEDPAAHTMTSKTAGKFDTDKIDPSGSGTFTAPAAGSYPVICKFHPKMEGTLTVT